MADMEYRDSSCLEVFIFRLVVIVFRRFKSEKFIFFFSGGLSGIRASG